MLGVERNSFLPDDQDDRCNFARQRESRHFWTHSGGMYPMWSRTGHELFFEALDNHIMAAAYTEKGDSFVADKPRVWSEKRLALVGSIGAVKNVDLAPDGKRVIALMPVETTAGQKAQNQVTFLLNFSDEVRRKVPAAK